jgi:transposase
LQPPGEAFNQPGFVADMGAAYNQACAALLPNAQGVIDRFHVAKLFNEAIDGQRKKSRGSTRHA